MKQLQQGDVLLNQVKSLPKNANLVEPKGNRHVLAEGEAHGHAHAIEEIDSVELYEVDDTLYLNVLSPAPLVHEEHGKIDLPIGIFEVGRVVEIDPFERATRIVLD